MTLRTVTPPSGAASLTISYDGGGTVLTAGPPGDVCGDAAAGASRRIQAPRRLPAGTARQAEREVRCPERL